VFDFRWELISFQDFINSILTLDEHAGAVIAGDFNEFVQTRSVFAPFDDILTEIDESSGVDPVERYTYIFDQNCTCPRERLSGDCELNLFQDHIM